MNQRILPLGAGFLMALGAAGCCMSGTGPVPVPGPIPSAVPAAIPAVDESAVTLGAGFAPDPYIVTTVAGGPIPGSTMSSGDVSCGGYLPAVPNVTLTTTTPVAGLRVVVRGHVGADPVLAVRLADGRVFCDDDGGGYPNPAITADVPAGVHQVYVGSFRSGESLPATVAFTTNPALTFDSLP